MNATKLKREKSDLIELPHKPPAFDSIIIIILVMISLDLSLPFALDQLENNHYLDSFPVLRNVLIPGGTPHPLVMLNQTLTPLKLMIRTVSIAICLLYLLLDFCRFPTSIIKNSLIAVLILIHIMIPVSFFISHRVVTGSTHLAHDGGVIQIEEAMKMLLMKHNPYTTDYTGTPLEGWRGFRNNVVYHLPYMPGAVLINLPLFISCRILDIPYDQRYMYLIAFIVVLVVIYKSIKRPEIGRAAVVLFALNPFFSRYFILGANDIILQLFLILSIFFLSRDRKVLSMTSLAIACSIKQFAWIFAPFIILSMLKTESLVPSKLFPYLQSNKRPLVIAAMLFTCLVAPFVLWDARSFYQDTFQYASGGLTTSYPMQGLHGYGFATVALFFRWVPDGNAQFPFFPIQCIAMGLCLVIFFRSIRLPINLPDSLTGASLTLFVFLFFSRYLHANFLGVIAFWPFYAWCLNADPPEE